MHVRPETGGNGQEGWGTPVRRGVSVAFGIGKPTAVAPGIYRLGSRRINWYAVTDGDHVTLIDAGAPRHWKQLERWLTATERSMSDIQSVILTHRHVDHIGCAERLRRETDAPVFVHEADVAAVQTPQGPPWHLIRRAYRPAIAALLFEGTVTGLASPPPVEDVRAIDERDRPPLPGDAEFLFLPGHTPGSIAVFVPEREVLFAGDVLATRDFLTGRRCPPKPMPAPFTMDVEGAYRSLERLEGVGEVTLLPGHGRPWRGDVGRLVRQLPNPDAAEGVDPGR